jgi:hypothetical protein
MKKKMVETVMPEQPKPRTTVTISKDQASSINVGQTVSLKVSGMVKGVREAYGDYRPKMYEVEIEDTKVSGIESNQADKALADLKGK